MATTRKPRYKNGMRYRRQGCLRCVYAGEILNKACFFLPASTLQNAECLVKRTLNEASLHINEGSFKEGNKQKRYLAISLRDNEKRYYELLIKKENLAVIGV